MCKFLRFWVCVFYLLFFLPAVRHGIFYSKGSAEEIYVTKIEASKDRGFDYLDIYTTGLTEGKGLLLEDKLVIEFPQAKISPEVEILKVPSARLKDIQIEEGKIIVTLAKDIEYEIVNVFGRNKSIVEIYDQMYTAFPREFAWEEANLKEKAPPLEVKKLEPAAGSEKFILSGKTIVIDPAHGGDDPGAFSESGIPEKHLTLKVAREIARLLQKAGATVYLTRNADRKNNLKDIVVFANQTNANLFISLHFNAARRSKISGTETFYYNGNSRKFAAILHKNLIYGIKRRDRGLRRTMFYTIHHTKMPAALIEPLFITNPEEEKLILKPAFQKEIAWDIAKGVKEYFRSQLR